MLLQIDVCTANDTRKSILEDNLVHLSNPVKKKLYRLLDEIENSDNQVTDDGYTVKVTLKDDSTYAYAPRRYAYAERIKLQEITDDLLKRGIIRVSMSPYCARIAPVRKKDGSLRLYVDLRSLKSGVETKISISVN